MSELTTDAREELTKIAQYILAGFNEANDIVDFATQNIDWILEESDPDLVDRLRKALK